MTTRLTALTFAAVVALSAPANAQFFSGPMVPSLGQQLAAERLAIGWVSNYLGRLPTPFEVNLVKNQLLSGTSPLAVQANILASNEFFARWGNNPQGFIQGLFVTTMGRNPIPAETAQLTPQLFRLGRYRFALEFLAMAQGGGPRPVVPPGNIF